MEPLTSDLLVSYSRGRFRLACREIGRRLTDFGDVHARVERTAVDGIALVHTSLNNRAVVARCRALFHTAPMSFRCTIKWAPVDYWCETDLEAMKALIEREISDRIAKDETWGMKIEKRRWQRYHTAEIVAYLAPSIERKVNLDNPDKLVHMDVIGARTAISLLQRGEVFSVNAPD